MANSKCNYSEETPSQVSVSSPNPAAEEFRTRELRLLRPGLSATSVPAAKGAKGAKGAQGTWPTGKRATATADESHAQTKTAKAAKGAKWPAPPSQPEEVQQPCSAPTKDDWPDFEQRDLDQRISLGDLLEQPQLKPDYLINGLVQRGGVTIVRGDADLQTAWYSNVLATYAAGGGTLYPYGYIPAVATSLAHTSPVPSLTWEQVPLSFRTLKGPGLRSQAVKNLDIVSMANHEKRHRNFLDRSDQMRLVDLISEDAQLVIVPDAFFSATKNVDDFELRNIGRMFEEIVAKGATLIMCVQMSQKEWLALKKQLRIPYPYNFVELLHDPAAPPDFGSGLIVQLSRISEFDTVPLRHRVSYVVKDEKMSLGFDLVDASDTLTAKQVAMAVRQARVKQLADQGMLGKDIAKELDVDPATVSRDLRIVSKLRTPRTEPGDEGGDDSANT